MRAQAFHLSTLKETPAEAEIVSHQLMLRAGLIRRLGSGLYTWMPLGLKIMRRVENIVREEMDRAGALEVLMPAVQPAELWQESKRWQEFGPQLLKIKDRAEREFCFGPTHEEVITDIARRDLKSYKQLPVNYYQIQSKFRDEIRPRFGVMRAREFIMKDAYSFDIDRDAMAKSYQLMYDAYTRIFSRMKLKFRAVEADSGAIGGSQSHEFHVLADTGEDAIAFSNQSDYAANIEKAEALALSSRGPATQEMRLIDTPSQKTISELSEFLNVAPENCLKTLLVQGKNGLVALLLRGDHELNEIKAEKLSQVSTPLRLANETEVKAACGAAPGSIGPVQLNITIIADRSAATMSNFVCGANQDGKHYVGVNWGRDLPEVETTDLRNVINGDPSPDGKGELHLGRGIEVGHVFQLGDKYSKSMGATVLDETGKAIAMQMGCYGIGISRIVAAAIEQNHDARGIIWPLPLTPFEVALVPINMNKSDSVRLAAEDIYAELAAAGIEVLLDDRPVRPGFSFADMDLIGIPHRVVISERSLAAKEFEYKYRRAENSENIPLDNLLDFLKDKLASEL